MYHLHYFLYYYSVWWVDPHIGMTISEQAAFLKFMAIVSLQMWAVLRLLNVALGFVIHSCTKLHLFQTKKQN